MNNKELIGIIDDATQKKRTYLDLTSKQLTELPYEIGKLTSLSSLWLFENELTELPPEIGLLKNLTELRLDRNKLTRLPPEIGKLTNLEQLNLSNNQLSGLPPEIGNYTNLWRFSIFHNQLTQLPSEIGNLTNLEQLNLSNNQLSELPPEIGNLTNLWQNQGRSWGLTLKNNNFNVLKKVLNKKNPQEIVKEILFTNYREGKIKDNELLVSIGTQRKIKKSELVKITKWLNTFRIRAYFAVDKDNPDIKLSRKSEEALHQVKQYLSNKYQNHISQVYDQKTQTK